MQALLRQDSGAAQSAVVEHPWPTAHDGQAPPQSTSVSFPFFRRSLHEGGLKKKVELTWLMVVNVARAVMMGMYPASVVEVAY